MTRSLLLLSLAASVACADLLAQSNSRGSGYNGALTNISSARAWGRRGAAYPGGEVGVSFQNDLCNPGTINIEWRAPMLPDHPKFSFMVAKLQGDRIVQISDWSYNKHAFLSLNNSGVCGTCQSTGTAGGQQMGVNCSDTYANSNNGDRTYLAPPTELDPWLGTWNPVGSYFDIGDPVQAGYPLAADGVRSLSTAGFDAVKNRVTIKEADLQSLAAGSLFFQIQVVHQGEPATNRANNIMSRPFTMTWSGTAWTAATPTATAATQGTLLTRWPGSTITIGGNGNDDGRFTIAVKVTGPTNGMWHYEYAVINTDNYRGGASFRVPMCANAIVQNFTFRDIDQNALNDWSASYTGSEVAFTAPANNPQNWNQLFNFGFDCNVAPVSGNATIDQARIGAGALNFTVPTTVPGLQASVYLGAGCGAPAANLYANGIANAGNLAFALNLTSAPGTPMLLAFSGTAGNTLLAPGCSAYIDMLNYSIVDLYVTDANGLAVVPAPIAPGTLPLDLTFQAATLVPNPPIMSLFGLSNGLTVRVGATACQ